MRNKTRLLTIICFLLALAVWSVFSAHSQAQGDLLGRINNLRAGLGLAPYAVNGALSAAAQAHANWMASTGNVSHNQPDGSTPSSRAVAAGYPSTFVSENIYMGTLASVDTAWTFWINSAIHYRGLTNPGYTEVGIATASGIGGNAYVLVFGNPTGWTPPPVSAGGNNDGEGNAAAAAPPSFVVGIDALGNIMHEIQPGQTLGDIAIIYGYTWSDLPYMMTINNMTDADIRDLEIGGIFLVPPRDGTFTPTPTQEGAPPPPDLSAATPEPIPVTDMAVLLETLNAATPTITPTGTLPPPVAFTPESTNAAESIALLTSPQAVTFDPSQMTPQWSVATVTPPAVAAVSNPSASGTTPQPASVPAQSTVSPVLLVAVALQVGIILAAGFEFLRKRGR